MNNVKLENLIKQRKEFIYINNDQSYKRCRVQVDRKGVVLRDIIKGNNLKTKKQQLCKTGDFIVAEIDAKVGGYGFITDELDGAIVSSHYFLFELNHSLILRNYLELLIQTDIIQQQINPQGSTNYSSIRPNAILNIQIPLPNIKEQLKIINRYSSVKDKLFQVKNLSDELKQLINDELPFSLLNRGNASPVSLKELIIEKKERVGNFFNNAKKVGVNNILGIVPLKGVKEMDFSNYKKVEKWDFIYNPMRVDVGSIGLYLSDLPAITSPDYVVFSIDNRKKLSPFLLLKYLKSKQGLIQISSNTVGSVRKRLYFNNLCKIEIPINNLLEKNDIDSIFYKANLITEELNKNNDFIEKIKLSFINKELLTF